MRRYGRSEGAPNEKGIHIDAEVTYCPLARLRACISNAISDRARVSPRARQRKAAAITHLRRVAWWSSKHRSSRKETRGRTHLLLAIVQRCSGLTYA